MRSMMRLSLVLVVGFVTGTACGDEVRRVVVVADATKSDAPKAKDSDVAEWKPRHIVTLFRTPNGEPRQTKTTAKMPYYTLSYRDINRGGKTERWQVRELAYRDQEVARASAGTAVLFCDDLVLRLGAGLDSKKYAFECTGRLRLHIDDMVIDCDSGKLTEGKFQIENAEVTVKGTTISSAQLTISVDITGVKTAELGTVTSGFELLPPPLGVPINRFPSSVLVPAPGRAFIDDDHREDFSKSDSAPE